MIFDGLKFVNGSKVENFIFPIGADFPNMPNIGEVFFNSTTKKPYIYDGLNWKALSIGSVGQTRNVRVFNSLNDVTNPVEGEIVYITSKKNGYIFINDGWSDLTPKADNTYDLAIWYDKNIAADDVVFQTIFSSDVIFHAGFAGSYFKIFSTLSSNLILKINKITPSSTIEIGLVTFTPSSANGIFSSNQYTQNVITFDKGDVISMECVNGNGAVAFAITLTGYVRGY